MLACRQRLVEVAGFKDLGPRCALHDRPDTGTIWCIWSRCVQGASLNKRGVVMKLVMNMVRKPFKAGEVIFDFGDKSDDLYLIHSGAVEIVSREGLVLATLKAGELFGEMASILGERERTARAVTATNAVIDVIDSTTMQRKLGEADPVLRALVRNLTIRLADANKMNEERWLLLNVYQSLAPDEIERP